MEFNDFPMFLGKSGKYEIHPPKLCAGIGRTKAAESFRGATRPSRASMPTRSVVSHTSPSTHSSAYFQDPLRVHASENRIWLLYCESLKH